MGKLPIQNLLYDYLAKEVLAVDTIAVMFLNCTLPVYGGTLFIARQDGGWFKLLVPTSQNKLNLCLIGYWRRFQQGIRIA